MSMPEDILKTRSFNLNEELTKYCDESSVCREGKPKFILFTGGVGVGKTTVRHQQFCKGYVHLDAAEIFANFTNGKYYEFPIAFEEPLELMGGCIIEKAIKEKHNIVVEVIGNSLEETRAIIDAMLSVGYEINLRAIECDPAEAYRRHLGAVDKDVNYISAFYTQQFHYKWILNAVRGIENI